LERLHIKYKDIIVTTFRSVGMSLNPDRSEDKELKIKALDKIIVRGWHRNILQTEEQDAVAAQTALEVEEDCQNGTIHTKIEAEKDEEEALEIGLLLIYKTLSCRAIYLYTLKSYQKTLSYTL
jgi:hypothetical protein